jgi:DtxR family Mn-dependent transcriptional regulator
LADCEVGATVTILRFENEAEDLLHYLKESGLEPGLTGTVAAKDVDQIAVAADGRTATVTTSVAETVSVRADPSPPPRVALPEQLVLARQRYGR